MILESTLTAYSIFTDDESLLIFLRAKKYSLEKAVKLMKYFLLCPTNFPQYFKNLDVTDPSMITIVKTGLVLVMPERDEDGCRILMYRPGLIDPKQFPVDDCFKIQIAVLEYLLSEEETQVAGVVSIYDFANFPKSLLTYLSFSDYRNIFYLLVNVLPLRLKAFYIVGLPPFARQFFEWGIGFMHTKLKERLKFVSDFEELKKFVDIQLLPEEYGGKISIQENIKYLQENLQKNRERILLLNDVDAEFERKKPSSKKDKNIKRDADLVTPGSFKKLQID